MVKEGFRKTDAGILPNDWLVDCLGKYSLVLRGGSPRPIQDYITESHDGINWIKIGDVKPGEKFVDHTEERIIPEGVSRSRAVQEGDFILSNSMSFGRPYILKIDGCIHDGWLVIQNYQNAFDRMYLYYVLSSELTFGQYKSMAAGSGVQNLNKEKVNKVVLPIPKKEEQIAIADTLSDIDELITSLEKLISKKKDIKVGAMQALVTGKRKLNGFNEEWDSTTLEKLCYLITKQTGFDYSAEIKPSLVMSYQEGTLPFIQNKDFEGYDINYDTDFYIPYDVAIKYPKILLNEKCLLISISGKIGNVAVFDNCKMAFAGGAVGIAKLKDNSLAEWCMLYLLSSYGQDQIFSHEKVGAQHNLTVEDVRNIEIQIPGKGERDAIVGILTDMDYDIKKLEEKLLKCRRIKQGMMNELLTGKIRLV